MKVLTRNILVNRSYLTRKFKIAGSPILQIATHGPALAQDPRATFELSAYDLIRTASKSKGNHLTYASVDKLVQSITANGVKRKLTGWDLGNNTVELFGGHHRALSAAIAGIEALDFALKPLCPFDRTIGRSIEEVSASYARVPENESLKPGHSYNPFPGFEPIRKDALYRLRMIYRAIITCSDNQLLDLGCNDGYFGIALSQHDFYPTFVDRSPSYLEVVKAKSIAVKQDCTIEQCDIDTFLKMCKRKYAAVLYTDVFYHTVLEKGPAVALAQLNAIIDITEERLIFAPGRWDRLESNGVTQKKLYSILLLKAKRIRFLGKDVDKHYGREIYCIEY